MKTLVTPATSIVLSLGLAFSVTANHNNNYTTQDPPQRCYNGGEYTGKYELWYDHSFRNKLTVDYINSAANEDLISDIHVQNYIAIVTPTDLNIDCREFIQKMSAVPGIKFAQVEKIPKQNLPGNGLL